MTALYKKNSAQNFIDAVAFPNSTFYAFAAEHKARIGGLVPTPYDDVYDTTINPYRTMLFGKQIAAGDVSLMIKRYDYTLGTIYYKYDDADPLLMSHQFYAIVNASSYYHVYKVLDNNNFSPSTIQPDFSSVDLNNDTFTTSDGYQWKYP